LVINPPKSPSAGDPPPDPLAFGSWGLRLQTPFRLNECARLYTLIEHFWLMQMLGNLGAKRNLYFMPPCSKNVPAPLLKPRSRFNYTLSKLIIFTIKSARNCPTISAMKTTKSKLIYEDKLNCNSSVTIQDFAKARS